MVVTESPVQLMLANVYLRTGLKHCVFVNASVMRIYVNDEIIALCRTLNLHGRFDKMEHIIASVSADANGLYLSIYARTT